MLLELCIEGVVGHEFVDERRREPDHGSPTINAFRHRQEIVRAINLRERRSFGRVRFNRSGSGSGSGLGDDGNDGFEGGNAGHLYLLYVADL